jgi:hypothetical protein
VDYVSNAETIRERRGARRTVAPLAFKYRTARNRLTDGGLTWCNTPRQIGVVRANNAWQIKEICAVFGSIR